MVSHRFLMIVSAFLRWSKGCLRGRLCNLIRAFAFPPKTPIKYLRAARLRSAPQRQFSTTQRIEIE